jgi:hypothetical protein
LLGNGLFLPEVVILRVPPTSTLSQDGHPRVVVSWEVLSSAAALAGDRAALATDEVEQLHVGSFLLRTVCPEADPSTVG